VTLQLQPLATMVVKLRAPIYLPDTPVGTRAIAEVAEVDMSGDRIRARMRGVAAADWLVIAPDQTLGTVDVRVTLETDDGAVIFAHYVGRVDLSQAPPVVYVAPLFDTGHPDYAWLSRIQAVAKGTFSEDMSVLTYEMFELR